MENICGSTKKVMSKKHYFTNLASLPTSILNWIEENTNNITVVLNEDGKILHVSKSVKNILGYEPTSLFGVNWKTILSSEEVANIAPVVNELSVNHKTLLIHVPDQNEKNISFECTIKKISEEDNTLYLGLLNDITNKQETEEMMVRSEKMSVAGQLAAGIAHEIRNPLTSLKGFIQLLQAGVDQKDAYYKIMIDEIDKIETITSELLFISKPLTDNKRKESLNDMIKDVLVLLNPQAKLRDIILQWNKHEDIHIYCDRSQIKQVLINLVKNAIEASEHEDTVQIHAQKTPEKVEIDVIDEGIGISEDIIHKLDEPFFTTKQTGTGLGLMITKNLLNHHHATIEIIQNEVNGSTFRIHFPINSEN